MGNRQKQYLLFGGSFDPVHNGHVALVKFIAAKKNFDKIFLVPVANAPHKEEALFSYKQRFLFLQKIFLSKKYSEFVKDTTEVFLSDIEKHLPAPQYSYRTLQELEKKYSGNWSVLMGQDSFVHFASWKNAALIAKKYPLYVAARKDAKENASSLEFIQEPIFLKNSLWNISSSQIKKQLLDLQELLRQKNFELFKKKEEDLKKNIPPEIFTELIKIFFEANTK